MKRNVITVLLIVGILLGSSTLSGAVNWRQFEGNTIRVLCHNTPVQQLVFSPLEDEFEKRTGIEVILEHYPETQWREKVRIELTAKNPNRDVFLTESGDFQLFAERGWYTDLRPFIENKELTSSDYDYPGDFPESLQRTVTVNDMIVAIPLDRILAPILYYRKDILEKYGISVPQTLAELEKAAKIVFEQSEGSIYGIVNRGKAQPATSPFSWVLSEFGGRWNDEEGNPTVNTPEAIQAFEWWGRVLRKYGPPGVVGYGWWEATSSFLQGQAAFSLEGGINPGYINDPKQSKVMGKVGYAVMPSGPAGPVVRKSERGGRKTFGLAISSYSEKKEIAWLYIQYMTSKEAFARYLIGGRLAARTSAWNDPQVLAESDAEWISTMKEATKIVYPNLYHVESIKDVRRAREIAGQPIETAILNRDVKAAADKAQKELEALLQRERE